MKSAKSAAEEAFLFIIQQNGAPYPARQYRFHPQRKWQFDFAWPHLVRDGWRLAVEVEGASGGTFGTAGRHQRRRGFLEDCEKYQEAWTLGWQVVRIAAPQLYDRNRICEPEVIDAIIRWLNGAEEMKG